MSRVFQALAGLALLFAATVGNAESRTISAVYFRDALSFSVPYEVAHSGETESGNNRIGNYIDVLINPPGREAPIQMNRPVARR